MAKDSSQEKTEQATPKRLREARKKGDVSKSKDLTMVFVMIIVFATIGLTSGHIAGEIKQFMKNSYELVGKVDITYSDLWMIGTMGFMTLLKVLGPILIAGVVAALVINLVQVGALVTTEPLKPKIEKLNPIEGFKNMFKTVTFIELAKNLLKLTIVIFLAYYTISDYKDEIMLSTKVHIIETVSLTGSIVYSFFVKVAAVFFVIALFDMGIQRWNYEKKHRMSKDEVKREYKQDEGDPQIKGERRRLHREMVFGNTKQNVKNADAVVSNPAHVAVAISYDRDEMAAPEVVAKGQKLFAEMILNIAREENVPIIRNIPLAWALLQIDEGEAIPEDLFEPVAEVLSLVFEMKEHGDVSLSEEEPPVEKADVGTFNPLDWFPP